MQQVTNWKNKPWVNYCLIVSCLLMYMICLLRYGTTTSSVALVEMGAKYNYAITFAGEYWRLVTAVFLHAGLEHLIFNLLALYFLGNELEQLLGHWRYALLFMVAGVGGTLLSFTLNPGSISVGASGGLYGLFASYMVLAYLFPESSYLKARATTYIVLVILNFLQAFMAPDVDNFGHLGGLLFGAMMTYVLGIPNVNRPSKRMRLIAVVLCLALIGACLMLGNYRTYVWLSNRY